ncbi:ATP-binding protein [Micromonospora costi]|uniref:ATP-binding protein n=1 Tax=Micromonospora costi TaxID=1530042 RepID=UPI001F4E7229|nr:BTAD domain-containing putative transcriptional regulator [Micromonospora costi]
MTAQARQQHRSDADRAGLLRDALTLWRGVPLAGLPSPWAADVRAALHRQYQDATLAWAEAELRLGNAAATADRLTDLLAADPFAEPVAAMLMRVRHALGRAADALNLYATIRTRLAEELGTDPTAELQAVHQMILRGTTSTPPAAPTPAHRPALLPPDAYGFVGREAQLTRLDEALNRPARQPTALPICIVTGAPGVGKTALAVHWAHRVRHRFPDGQLYLDLRGFGPGPSALTTAQAVRRFLDALGIAPRRVPADVDAQLDLYRSELASRRVLLLLDNARDVAQARPLLAGGAGSMVLLTSRSRLTGLVATGGAQPVHLDVFSQAESRQFLLRRIDDGRADADPAAIARITEHCGRLPLALAMVAAQAVQRPAFPLATLTEDLARPGSRLDALGGDDAATDLRSVFAHSYAALDPAAARLFTLLGVWSEPEVTLATAASLAGTPLPDTRRTLARLADAHLVVERSTGRYVVHDLLLEYAGERHLDDAAREAATRRALDHLLHTAHAANVALATRRVPNPLAPPRRGVVVEPVGSMDDAFDWFSRELTHLTGAVERAGRTRALTTYVPQLADAMSTFLYRRGYWAEQLAVQEAALRASRELGHVAGEARARLLIGHALTPIGRHDDAEDNYLSALTLFTTVGDIDSQAQTHRHLAWLNECRDRYTDALRHAREALALTAKAGTEHAQAEALNQAGWYHTLLDQYTEAVDYSQRALHLHRRQGNRAGEANALDSLGYAFHRQGRHADAIRHYERALGLFRTIGARLDEAEVLDHLGDAHAAVGAGEAARAAWTDALAIVEPLGYAGASALRAKLNSQTAPGTQPPWPAPKEA